MTKIHNLRLDKLVDGIQFIICDNCLWEAVLERDEPGRLLLDTKMKIREGDPEVAHVFVQTV